MTKTILWMVFMLVAKTGFTQEIMRQRSTTEGLGIGLFGQLGSWSTTSKDFSALSDKSSGAGLGIRVGYGITQRLEPYFRADYSTLTNSDYTTMKTKLSHYDLGLRFNFGSTIKRFRPFAELAASSVNAVIDPLPYNKDDYHLGLHGYGLTGGLGFNFFVSSALALNLEYSAVLVGQFNKSVDFGYSGETTTKQDITGGDILIGTGRLSLGVSYYLKGRR
jgi:hypothetical protein